MRIHPEGGKAMEGTNVSTNSLLGLIRDATGNTRKLVREELQLAKTELSEKMSVMGRNVAILAIGGAVAYSGLLVILIALGWLAASWFEQLGLSRPLAVAAGIGSVGLIVMVTGAATLLKAYSKLKHGSLAPTRTIETLQELRGTADAGVTAKELSSQEMQTRVRATEENLGQTLEELGRRLDPAHINQQVKLKIQEQPYKTGAIAMFLGLVSGLFLRRRHRAD